MGADNDERFESSEIPDDSEAALGRNSSAGFSISKRAGRRLIQRAFVLVGRDRTVRQHIREARLTMLWALADWKFEWTVALNRGKVLFDRRPTRKPDLTLTWPNAEEFFRNVEGGRTVDNTLQTEGDLRLQRYSEPVRRAFYRLLGEVMRHPFDEAGNPLV